MRTLDVIDGKKEKRSLACARALPVLLGCFCCLAITAGCAVPTYVDHSEDELREAVVERVVDGDTIVVKIDGESQRVRFIGVDTPESVAPEEERNTEEGDLASEHTKSLLPEGAHVWLEKDTSDTDQYGRLLRYVWLAIPDDPNSESEVRAKMINAQLVADGWAEAKSYRPDTKWDELFAKIQEEATNN